MGNSLCIIEDMVGNINKSSDKRTGRTGAGMDLTQDTVKKIRGLIVFAVAVVVAGINYRSVLLVFMRFVGMLAPFLLGAAIAFVLNVPMRWIENHIRTGKSDRVRRRCV